MATTAPAARTSHVADAGGQGFGPEVKRRIMLGTYALSSGYYDAYYGKAQQVRTLIRQDFDAAFARVDVHRVADDADDRVPHRGAADDPLAMYLADLYTIPSDLAGNAAISVPCGLAPEDGLPVGLQIMAPAVADDRTYRVGAASRRHLEQRWGGPLLAQARDCPVNGLAQVGGSAVRSGAAP